VLPALVGNGGRRSLDNHCPSNRPEPIPRDRRVSGLIGFSEDAGWKANMVRVMSTSGLAVVSHSRVPSELMLRGGTLSRGAKGVRRSFSSPHAMLETAAAAAAAAAAATPGLRFGLLEGAVLDASGLHTITSTRSAQHASVNVVRGGSGGGAAIATSRISPVFRRTLGAERGDGGGGTLPPVPHYCPLLDALVVAFSSVCTWSMVDEGWQ
jgi:hypothetical protein